MNFTSSITLMFKDAFSSGFQQAQNSFAGMKSAMGEINENQEMNRMAADLSMMTAMTDPMRQALSNALDQPARIAGTMDSSLRNIQAVTGSTAEEMNGLRRELLSVGGRAIAGPEKVAAAYYDVASGVTDVSARMATLEASVALAEAGQADLGTATGGLIKVMNAYNFSADQANFAADVFTATVGKGVGSMDEFVSAMSPIAGLTSSVGIGFDEVGASMAYITSKGQTASAAGTQLRAAVTSLLNPNETLNRLLQSMGMESGSAMLEQYGLAESLGMISTALGGSSDAMARALGSTEALQGAIALTQDGFSSFADTYKSGLEGVTEQARGVQLESIEAKMARLEAASGSLQAQIGGDINQIRGFFVDMKIGFLENVAAPIMESPVGPAVSKITAFVGEGAKAMLNMGSGALNTAAQLSVLTANIQNAGGIAKLFKSSLSLLGAPFKMVSGLARGFIFRLFGIGGASATASGGTGAFGAASAGATGGIGAATGATTAFGASLWATMWPILAVVGAVALIVGGAYLLIKHWDKVSGFFSRMWEGIKSAFTSAWDWLVGIFQKGMEWIKGVIFGASDWVLGAVALFFPFIGIPALVIKHWDSIKEFFANLWTGMVGGFQSAWEGIKGFFANLWEGVKGVITGFVDWVSGIIDFFLAPFRAIFDGISSIFGGITNVVGGIVDKVGGVVGGIGDFFGGLFGGAKESGSQMNDAFAQGIQSNASAPASAFGNSLRGIDSQMPHSDADEGPLSRLSASGRALTNTFARGMDPSALEQRASQVFASAAPSGEYTIPEGRDTSDDRARPSQVTIQNLYVQSEDFENAYDFIRQIMHMVERPQGVPV